MHYQKGKDRSQFFLTSLESMVVADSWARLVDVFVDAMPILDFGFTHSKLNKEGNVPYHPSDLFKLLLYGYRHGIRSANKLHQATKINVEVVRLLKGCQPSAQALHLVFIFKRGITKKPYTGKRCGTDKCATCSLRQNCTRNKNGRFIERPIHQDYIDRNNARVTRYKDFYRLRQQIIEHVFDGRAFSEQSECPLDIQANEPQQRMGKAKRHWGMDYTLLHGKQKAVSEYQLAAIAYNLKRSVSILGLDELQRRLKALILAIFGPFSSMVRYSASQYENQIIQLRKIATGRSLRKA